MLNLLGLVVFVNHNWCSYFVKCINDFIVHAHNYFLLPPSSGWNNVIWGGQAGSVSSGLQARVFPAGGCSATQSPVPLWSGVCILVLRWERAVQDLQVCVCVVCCMPGPMLECLQVFQWQSKCFINYPLTRWLVSMRVYFSLIDSHWTGSWEGKTCLAKID